MSVNVLKMQAVVDITSLSRRTIYTLIEKGDFPKQVNLTAKSVGWIEKEVYDWIESRATDRFKE